jgi:hypothetical protein
LPSTPFRPNSIHFPSLSHLTSGPDQLRSPKCPISIPSVTYMPAAAEQAEEAAAMVGFSGSGTRGPRRCGPLAEAHNGAPRWWWAAARLPWLSLQIQPPEVATGGVQVPHAAGCHHGGPARGGGARVPASVISTPVSGGIAREARVGLLGMNSWYLYCPRPTTAWRGVPCRSSCRTSLTPGAHCHP